MMAFTQPDPLAADTDVELEMLEFLGSWETNDGEWIDPTMLPDESEIDVSPDTQEND